MRIALGVLSLASLCNAEGVQSGAQPTCTAAIRGVIWNVEGGAGVADRREVCQKTAGDTYAWYSGVFVPSGAIIAITSGACATGWTEATDLAGKMLYGTIAANGDIGGTGGSDTVTPAGTNSAPAFTGSALGTHLHGVGTYAGAAASAGTPAGTNSTSTVTPLGTIAWPAGVPTYTGSQVTSGATTGGTPAGTNSTSATSGNCAATNIAAGTGSTTACKATAPNLTVTAQTFTGSALATHTHTVTASGTNAWPAGVPTLSGSSSTVGAQTFTGSAMGNHSHSMSGSSEAVSAGTPAGTVAAPVFSGTQFDNRSAFVKVIFCRKT